MSLHTLALTNSERLQSQIHRLAEIGQCPDGSISRLAFTPEDLQARYLVQQWMMQAGMSVRTDAAGNLIGTYAGTEPGAPALATGSHIDTVPAGGRFDGVLGVLAGIEVVRTLQERQQRLRHPLEVIVFTDEESTMIGAQAMAGTVLSESPERYQPQIGGKIQSALARLGGDWEQIASAQRSRADMAAFIELHVEQGAVLESQGCDIGVVQGVVGISRKAITVVGQANHAGTTPMRQRQDALLAAAEIVRAVYQIALQQPGEPVATVGSLEVSPNAVNIVPGKVELSVDMRDLSKPCLDQMVANLRQQMNAIAIATHTHIDMLSLLCVEPTLAAKPIQNIITNVCKDLDLKACALPSRAGHDALEIGRVTDMGMIFVPSQSGVSHSEAEYTSPQQCAQGADVLLHTLQQLDAFYSV